MFFLNFNCLILKAYLLYHNSSTPVVLNLSCSWHRGHNFFVFNFFQTGHTALQRAAAEGHSAVVQHLIERGAPVDHQDEVVSNNRFSMLCD